MIINNQKKNTIETVKQPEIKNISEVAKKPRDRSQYLKTYYEDNKIKMINQVKNNSNQKKNYIRLLRENKFRYY